MSLWVLNNNNSGQVANDLRLICPDPAMSVDTWISADGQSRGTGAVTYPAPSISSFGSQIISQLVNSPVSIGVRGEADIWSRTPTPGATLQNCGGLTLPDASPPTFIEVVYDIYPCNGNGFWVQDSGGKHVDFPTDVCLVHEMGHAIAYIAGITDPAIQEARAIATENSYRSQRQLPRRSGHAGGCKPQPAPNAPPAKSGSNCFIATAAFGSSIAEEVQTLRSFRDDVLLQTRAGEQFFTRFYEHYYRVSPLIVEAMHENSEVKDLVRWSIVTPIVRYLEFLVTFPDASSVGLEEPWRSFLEKMRDDLEAWSEEIELPRKFSDLQPAAAAREIGIVLKYALRCDAKREAYLRDLERAGEIPLVGTAAELHAVDEYLRFRGVPQRMVRRVVRDTQRPVPVLLGHAMNINEVIVTTDNPPSTGEWVYQVQMINLSGAPVDEIALFYSTTDAPTAVVHLSQFNVQNGQVATFILGSCDQLNAPGGYVVGVFVGNQRVALIPDPSNPIFGGASRIDAALDHQIHPTDPPCLGGWSIH